MVDIWEYATGWEICVSLPFRHHENKYIKTQGRITDHREAAVFPKSTSFLGPGQSCLSWRVCVCVQGWAPASHTALDLSPLAEVHSGDGSSTWVPLSTLKTQTELLAGVLGLGPARDAVGLEEASQKMGDGPLSFIPPHVGGVLPMLAPQEQAGSQVPLMSLTSL